VIPYLLVRWTRLPRFELAAVLAALLASGCGLVDGSQEGRSAASWCEEKGVGDIAEVELSRKEAEGVFRDRTVVLRDAQGRALVHVAFPKSGPPDVPNANSPGERIEYTLDAAGNVIESSVDEGLDGVVDGVSTRTYDEEGRPVGRLSDAGNDGDIDSTETWDYSIPNQVWRYLDEDADGQADAIEVSTYSESGVLIRRDRDEDADGVADSTTTYSLDENGLVLESTYVDDLRFVSETETYEYDDQARLVRKVEARDEHGYVKITESMYEYDDQSRLVRMVRNEDELLGPDVTEVTYEYDEASRLTLTRTTIAEGYWETERQIYDSEGRLVRVETHDMTGALRTAQEYEYDGSKLVRRSWDGDGDGTWDTETTWTAC